MDSNMDSENLIPTPGSRLEKLQAKLQAKSQAKKTKPKRVKTGGRQRAVPIFTCEEDIWKLHDAAVVNSNIREAKVWAERAHAFVGIQERKIDAERLRQSNNDAEVARMKSEVVTLQNQIEDLRMNLTVKDVTIDGMRKKVEDYDQMSAALNNALADISAAQSQAQKDRAKLVEAQKHEKQAVEIARKLREQFDEPYRQMLQPLVDMLRDAERFLFNPTVFNEKMNLAQQLFTRILDLRREDHARASTVASACEN
jgi:hypothetical protein